jgi:hypothetical protein
MLGARLGLLTCVALAALAAGCATTDPTVIMPLPPPPRAATPAAVRLAWLPFEMRAAPDLATAVNERLARVVVDGVTETFAAPVSMEMAQLAIECIDHTPACYGAVGQSVGADRLLWAEMDRGPRGAITLRVALFDVGGGAITQKVSRGFPSAKAARAGVGPLVDATFGAGDGAARSAP